MRQTGTTLVARQDSAGDVLLAGPAIRAVAAAGRRVVLLVGPRGHDAATLLPGVDEIVRWAAPWIDATPPPVEADRVAALVDRVRAESVEDAVILTSFHQCALPLALLLRLAGVGRITAISEEYPGSLLDVRHRVDGDPPEAERALSVAAAAGYPLPDVDSTRLAVRRPLPDADHLLPAGPYVAVHPGTAAPARAWPTERWAGAVETLSRHGHQVLVTGAPHECELTASVAGTDGIDLGGRTDLGQLAAVLDRADAVVVANTGPAHLAAAVGTPVVSLFAPTVPAARWAPYGVPLELLGDQDAPCAGTRATTCPVPGHPCLTKVLPDDVADAVDRLVEVNTCAS